MKAIVYYSYGSADVLELRDIDRPTARDGEVLVRVHAASVNPYDWHFMTGWPYIMRVQTGLRRPKKPVLGADLAGVVEAVGATVTQFEIGDEVFGEGSESYAEYVCISEERLALKPTNASFEQAAAVPMAGLTALQGLRGGKIADGQRVLINGASGGVGTFAVQIAKASGAEVTAVCSSRNTDMVLSIGADHVIDYTQEEFTKNGESYDLILDNICNHALKDCRRVLKSDGYYVATGAPKGRRPGKGPFVYMIKVMLASTFGRHNAVVISTKIRRDDLEVMKDLIESGKVTPVIDRNYKLSETADALRHQAEGHAQGKTVITI